MPKCLVTGAAGFLGFYVASALSRRPGWSVVCVDNFSRGEKDAAYDTLTDLPNVEHITIDLTDAAAVRTLPRDIDIVFHLAALNGTQNFYERPFEVVRSCTLPTIHLLDHYGPAGSLARFVYAGTSEAYAATVSRFQWEVPTGEDVPLAIEDVFNSRWSYGGSKMHGEIATINGCRHFGLPFTIVRYHNAYGPRMGDKHVIPDFLQRARRGVFELYGYEDTRSFIYADDAAASTIALAESAAADGKVINVGGGSEITMLELGRMMMRVGGFDGEIALHPSPAGSVKRRAPKLDRLKEIVDIGGWRGLESGLELTADFYLGR
jgi:nucleoside-diphosphate-sugar epimerase